MRKKTKGCPRSSENVFGGDLDTSAIEPKALARNKNIYNQLRFPRVRRKRETWHGSVTFSGGLPCYELGVESASVSRRPTGRPATDASVETNDSSSDP